MASDNMFRLNSEQLDHTNALTHLINSYHSDQEEVLIKIYEHYDIEKFVTKRQTNSQSLSILSLNCQSIRSKLMAMIEKSCHFKIIALQANWLGEGMIMAYIN